MTVSRPAVEYELLPSGLVPAVCVNYFDIGLQPGYQNKPQHKVVIMWELEARRADGARFIATKKYTASLSDKATLTADLQSWRGRAFTPEQLDGFDLDNILGKPCQLNLVQIVKGNGDPFVEIATVLPPPKGWVAFAPETEPGHTPDWVAKCINEQLPPPDPARAGMAAYAAASGSSGRDYDETIF
jgi:hypothetical protein